jgi:hypothetical protein
VDLDAQDLPVPLHLSEVFRGDRSGSDGSQRRREGFSPAARVPTSSRPRMDAGDVSEVLCATARLRRSSAWRGELGSVVIVEIRFQ